MSQPTRSDRNKYDLSVLCASFLGLHLKKHDVAVTSTNPASLGILKGDVFGYVKVSVQIKGRSSKIGTFKLYLWLKYKDLALDTKIIFNPVDIMSIENAAQETAKKINVFASI